MLMSDQLPGVWLCLPRAWFCLLTGEVGDDIWRWGTWGGAGDGSSDNTGAGGVLQVGHSLLLSQSSSQLLQGSAGYRTVVNVRI